MDKLVYLAGPILGLNYKKCTDWREYAINELLKDGITGLSPMRAKEFLKKYSELVDRASKHVLNTDSGIATRDMWDVRRSGIVLFNLLDSKQVSIGTMIEYGWASAFNKPIVSVMEKKDNEKRNVHEHAIVRRLNGYRVETLEEGLTVVRALFAY
ncbi:unnamed protein product [marine sediment metagenome]|uniref:Nucleoside 2-deoxyribosyltransferase n=1 Tax=marine sediment metagenome TaxID=412755 RepID=X1V5P3_9ZZZZ